MDFLKFIVSGDYAAFAKPTKNTKCIYTFQHIHKIAVYGIIGATLGFNSYETAFKKYPEFYDKLKDVRMAIIPSKTAYKKLRYPLDVDDKRRVKSKGRIVEKQLLINPSWTIYIPMSDPYISDFAKSLMDNKTVYERFLGSRECKAIISNISRIVLPEQTIRFTNSIVEFDKIKFSPDDKPFEEKMPIKLNDRAQYFYKNMVISKSEFKEPEKGYIDGQKRFILI